MKKGTYEAIFKDEHTILGAGIYFLSVGLSTYERTIHYVENVVAISISEVPDPSLDKSIVRTAGVGLILNPMDVDIFKI